MSQNKRSKIDDECYQDKTIKKEMFELLSVLSLREKSKDFSDVMIKKKIKEDNKSKKIDVDKVELDVRFRKSF